MPRSRAAGVSSAHALALRAAEAALAKKASDVVILHVGDISPVADFFVLATGTSDPQVRAIVDAVEDALAEAGHTAWHVEGRTALRWVLLDYVDVVVHVFRESAREFYMLDRLWGDARREVVEDTGPRPRARGDGSRARSGHGGTDAGQSASGERPAP